jgi:hypothetical protein
MGGLKPEVYHYSMQLLPGCEEGGAYGFEIFQELWDDGVEIIDVVDHSNRHT